MKKRFSVWIYAAMVGGACVVFSHALFAELPARPALEGFSFQPRVAPAPQETLARIELSSGRVERYTPSRKARSSAQSGMALANGDVIQTTQDPNSRCRVVFADGDVVHLGPGSLIGVEKRGDTYMVNLWQGTLMAYAMPLIQGRHHPLILQTPQGALELITGKAALFIEKAETRVALFDNVGRWLDRAGRKILVAGQMAQIRPGSLKLAPIPSGMEAKVTEQTSPEVPAVKQALQSFRNRDFAGAQRILSQVQSAFPYNGVAAYYLGLMQLEANNLPNAIHQWQKYAEIDPEGAKEKRLSQQLTLIITQAIKEEVQQALANEKRLSTLPPEPNSIAVHPLTNKGAKRYEAIGKGITALVISDLAKVPNLKVLEREKIQKLLDEIRLSERGLVEEASALRAGRMLRAEKLMIGDYKIEPEKEQP